MLVTIAILALNEENYLNKLLDDILAQTYPHNLIEILLVDSFSTDKTWIIMSEFQKKHIQQFNDIKLFKNPKRIQAAGWNVALQHYTGDAITKIDAHASIPPQFIHLNVKCLMNGEYVSSGQRPNVINEPNNWKQLLLTAENSMFGSSIAPFRRNTGKHYVKSAFHGMYRREVFEKAGWFNENLGRTEDNEMNYRICKNGYHICFDPAIISYQYTRPTLAQMLKQKFSNGYWIGKTFKICPACLNWYHFIPFLFVMGIFITLVWTYWRGPDLLYLLFGSYTIFCLIATLSSIKTSKHIGYNFMLPFMFFMLHISYGFGTVIGFFSCIKKGKQNEDKSINKSI